MYENGYIDPRVKRTKKKTLIILAVLLLVFLLPVIFVCVSVFALPPVYEDTFVGELADKYELLCKTDEEKIVVIGGSSVAFGLDSALMEKHLGRRVVNFGLYADLGTKVMLDLSRANINEGDIIVLAPEMNDQTLSLYFNAETTMQALDGNFGMIANIDSDNYEALIGASWGFSADKLGYLISGKKPENVGAYSKEWFNEYGDNTYDRPYNVMSTISKNITLDFKVDKDDGVTTEYEEFIDYLNEYIDFCRERGATVYFTFSPMNEAALTDYNTDENVYAFYENLRSSLNCRVISDINECIMDEGYFFDSEFHLNNSGVTVRTVRLIDDIKRELGITDITMNEGVLPAPSGYAPVEFTGGEEENLYFVLEAAKNGAGQDVWHIVGLNELGKTQVALSIPNMTDGKPIIKIAEGALEGAEVRTLVIGDNITRLDSGSLGGAKHLGAVYISKPNPASVSVPNDQDENGLATKGAPESLKIYIPEKSIPRYVEDYFWGSYSKYLKGN